MRLLLTANIFFLRWDKLPFAWQRLTLYLVLTGFLSAQPLNEFLCSDLNQWVFWAIYEYVKTEAAVPQLRFVEQTQTTTIATDDNGCAGALTNFHFTVQQSCASYVRPQWWPVY